MSSKTPFNKLLIANRGEIAVRIAQTARELGLTTVAVYSDADRHGLHVGVADEAVHIGASDPAGSYLNIEAIIDAAKASRCDAVHPGYGFLAESPAFAIACKKAGLVFVGPSAEAIALMGDKAAARRHVEKAGVAVVPGYDGADQSSDVLLAEAEKIGLPVMIKAAHGGGGRGMRLVEDLTRFDDLLASARSEAMAAFGDDTVLLERALGDVRHVEIQIASDRDGNVVHFGERDCSIQRRHQKIIEEAPSPAVTPELREEISSAAIKVLDGLGYEGVGTVEFLLDGEGQFYFLEMNTRLQVEHPVTEVVTGIDLVALQLRLAAGEPLGMAQSDISINGHAIEARLCAEKPDDGFVPQSGTIRYWQNASGVRCDSGVDSGSVVSPYYDSLLAKLIVHSDSRSDAVKSLGAAFSKMVVLGLETNRAYLQSLLQTEAFEQGDVTTGFLDRLPSQGATNYLNDELRAAAVTASLMRVVPGGVLVSDFAVPMRLARDGVVYDVSVTAGPKGFWEAQVLAKTFALTVTAAEGPRICYQSEGSDQVAWLVEMDGRVHVQLGDEDFVFDDLTFQPALEASGGGSDGRVLATMTGKVVSVSVKAGDMVKMGDSLAVLEAMKMEHLHRAPVDGVVTGVHVSGGQQVARGALLVEVEPA